MCASNSVPPVRGFTRLCKMRYYTSSPVAALPARSPEQQEKLRQLLAAQQPGQAEINAREAAIMAKSTRRAPEDAPRFRNAQYRRATEQAAAMASRADDRFGQRTQDGAGAQFAVASAKNPEQRAKIKIRGERTGQRRAGVHKNRPKAKSRRMLSSDVQRQRVGAHLRGRQSILRRVVHRRNQLDGGKGRQVPANKRAARAP